jgi:hypothetical protein
LEAVRTNFPSVVDFIAQRIAKAPTFDSQVPGREDPNLIRANLLDFCFRYHIILRIRDILRDCEKAGFLAISFRRKSFEWIVANASALPQFRSVASAVKKSEGRGLSACLVAQIGRHLQTLPETLDTFTAEGSLWVSQMRPYVRSAHDAYMADTHLIPCYTDLMASVMSPVPSPALFDPFLLGSMFVDLELNLPPSSPSALLEGLARVQEVAGAVKPLLMKERMVVVRVPAPSHSYHAVLGLNLGITERRFPDSQSLLFCNPRSGFEAKLTALSEENTTGASNSEILKKTVFLIHPEALLESELNHLTHFTQLRSGDRTGIPIVIVTSLEPKHLLPEFDRHVSVTLNVDRHYIKECCELAVRARNHHIFADF